MGRSVLCQCFKSGRSKYTLCCQTYVHAQTLHSYVFLEHLFSKPMFINRELVLRITDSVFEHDCRDFQSQKSSVYMKYMCTVALSCRREGPSANFCSEAHNYLKYCYIDVALRCARSRIKMDSFWLFFGHLQNLNLYNSVFVNVTVLCIADVFVLP